MFYRITNKWIVLIGAISAQVAIGALYAWSLFNTPISEAYGWDFTTVIMTYSVSLSAFSLSTMLSGRLQLKIGPRYTALIGAVLYSSGILLSSQATSPYMLFLTYGVMGGAGVGFVYVCPLSTLVQWFPRRRGLVTGLATASFAIGGLVFKTVIGDMFDVDVYTVDLVSSTFITLGIIYSIMTIGGSLLLDVPKDGGTVTKKVNVTEGRNYKTKEMLKTSTFKILLMSDLLALMPGLLVIGLAKDIATEYVKLDYELAVGIVGIIAISNAAGRLVSGLIADRFGALRIYRIMYVVTIASLAVLAFVPLNYEIFLIAILGIAIGYGSFLSLVPTIVGQMFGGKYFSANYSFLFQAYGIAVWIGFFIKKYTTAFDQTFFVAMAAAFGGLVFAMLIRPEKEPEEVEELHFVEAV